MPEKNIFLTLSNSIKSLPLSVGFLLINLGTKLARPTYFIYTLYYSG